MLNSCLSEVLEGPYLSGILPTRHSLITNSVWSLLSFIFALFYSFLVSPCLYSDPLTLTPAIWHLSLILDQETITQWNRNSISWSDISKRSVASFIIAGIACLQNCRNDTGAEYSRLLLSSGILYLKKKIEDSEFPNRRPKFCPKQIRSNLPV